MVPLGPFNAKNFGTSVSPWVVTFDALDKFLVKGLESERQLLSYLTDEKGGRVPDIKLGVDLKSGLCSTCCMCDKTNKNVAKNGERQTITETSSTNLLFSFPQMLTHHTVGGCPFNSGDLLGSGTISGRERGSFGSLFEQNDGGKASIELCGEKRVFLEDFDTVTFTGVCGSEEYELVGFGECAGTIQPAFNFD